mmetsp:Transcript_3053/g.11063  ORF Transcript_3053/g.11063 Transcript_3053/m.11063 type:complete len:407 (-) Transcript_3053:392-1612(-)
MFRSQLGPCAAFQHHADDWRARFERVCNHSFDHLSHLVRSCSSRCRRRSCLATLQHNVQTQKKPSRVPLALKDASFHNLPDTERVRRHVILRQSEFPSRHESFDAAIEPHESAVLLHARDDAVRDQANLRVFVAREDWKLRFDEGLFVGEHKLLVRGLAIQDAARHLRPNLELAGGVRDATIRDVRGGANSLDRVAQPHHRAVVVQSHHRTLHKHPGLDVLVAEELLLDHGRFEREGGERIHRSMPEHASAHRSANLESLFQLFNFGIRGVRDVDVAGALRHTLRFGRYRDEHPNRRIDPRNDAALNQGAGARDGWRSGPVDDVLLQRETDALRDEVDMHYPRLELGAYRVVLLPRGAWKLRPEVEPVHDAGEVPEKAEDQSVGEHLLHACANEHPGHERVYLHSR